MQPIDFRLDHFTTSQRILDVAGIALGVAILLVWTGLACILLSAAWQKKAIAHRVLVLKMLGTFSAACVLVISIAVMEGARALRITPRSVEVAYRFKPTKAVTLGEIKGATHERRESNRMKGKRVSHRLIIQLGDRQLIIHPLVQSAKSIESLKSAAKSLNDTGWANERN